MFNVIVPYKNRTIDFTSTVKVYRNLNKKGVWYSLVQNGLTVAHASAVCLNDCSFNVNEKTRQWVIRNNRKVFHAYIEGTIQPSFIETTTNNDLSAIIKYNPYKHMGFMVVNLKTKPFIIKKASVVICNQEGVKASCTI